MKNAIKIGHYADIQVKVRELNLADSYRNNLENIEKEIEERKLEVVVIAGDFFEFDEPNDLERKIMYNHFARVLRISTVMEVVLMSGNHDLAKDRKQLESNIGSNAVDTFNDFLKKLQPELAAKVIYLKEQKQYKSNVYSWLGYIAYSLEDGTSAGSNLNHSLIDKSLFNICVYHDILKEYIDWKKLPVKKSVYDRMISIEEFQSDLILAGDIHELWNTTSLDDSKKFFYPGSTLERNFGEGTYIKIRKSVDLKKAAPKFMLVHSLNNVDAYNTVNHSAEYIQLKSYVNHIDIDLNSTVVYDNFLSHLEKSLFECEFGINQTFIKLRLSNAFLMHEMDIFKTINNITKSKTGVTTIDLRYEKIIAKNSVANASLMSHLIVDENGEQTEIEITTDNVVENFDNILLNKEKLINLFKLQLDSNKPALLKELGDAEQLDIVYQNIVGLFEEQIELSLGSVPNFVTRLMDIETNGFMQLTSNKINLDIPGLTRITGTNGVGKTTLYNMIRWVIDDLLFENLKSNQKVANSLLVFNDELSNVDEVIVKLNATVNNTPIAITRWVARKWKANTTDEQKSSIDWKKYISDCARGVKLEVFSASKGTTIKTGDEAENLIKKWFGNTVNTIMILNSHKINTMLNLKSDELRQLVLDYIGVDYLNILDKNLDQVKLEYSLQKPKRNKQEIRTEIESQELLNKNGETKTKKLSEELILLESELKVITDKEKIINDKLLNLGNIPELIKTTETNITSTQENINNFVAKVKVELPTFTKVAPKQQNTKSNQDIIDANKITIEANNKLIESNKLLVEADYGTLYDAINININKLKTAFNDGFKKLEDECSNKIVLDKQDLNVLVDELTKSLALSKNTEQEFVNNNLKLKNEALTKIATLTNDANKLQSEIDNGCCSECNRLLDDFTPEHKAQKEFEIKNINKKIDLLNKELDGIIPEIDVNGNMDESKIIFGYNQKIIEHTNKVNKIQLFINEINKGNYQYFTKEIISNNINILNGITDIINCNTDISNLELKLDHLKRKDVQYAKETLKLDLYFKIEEKLTELNGILTLISNRKIDELLLTKIDKTKYLQIDNIVKLNVSINLLVENNNTYETSNKTNQKIIDDALSTYTTELETFNSDQQAYTKNLNDAVEENNTVDEHNKGLETFKNSLLHHQNALLKYQNNLDSHTKLTEEKLTEAKLNSDKSIEIQTTKDNQNSLKNELANVDEKIKQLQIEYLEFLKYQKDTAIFNMYSKIIKKDFKDSVFGYYREFLNITLNLLLDEVNFKLQWEKDGSLYYYEVKNNKEIWRPVQLVSGMQTAFLGLSLIYTIHTLNVKNNMSHLFIDEISGQLNSGKELTKKEDAINYQEKLLLLLSKFTHKNIFIIDHVINNLFQTQTYEVQSSEKGSKYVAID